VFAGFALAVGSGALQPFAGVLRVGLHASAFGQGHAPVVARKANVADLIRLLGALLEQCGGLGQIRLDAAAVLVHLRQPDQRIHVVPAGYAVFEDGFGCREITGLGGDVAVHAFDALGAVDIGLVAHFVVGSGLIGANH